MQNDILTHEAKLFLNSLSNNFEHKIQKLIEDRKKRKTSVPDFLQ